MRVIKGLEGKVAIVTGASRGIGKAIALGLANAGVKVIVTARTIEETARIGGDLISVVRQCPILKITTPTNGGMRTCQTRSDRPRWPRASR